MTTALVPYQAIAANPQTALQFVETMGDAFAKGGIAGVSTPGQGKVMALTCLCENLTPLEFMRTYHIIEGKPTMRSDAMLAKFRLAGGRVAWLNVGDDGKEARANFTFDGQTLEVAYTIEDAKRAGMVKPKSNWEKDPGSMLRARVISKAVRILAPEIVAGVYAPEEFGDTSEPEPAAPAANGKGRKAKAAPSPPQAPPAEDVDFEVQSTAEQPFGEPTPPAEDKETAAASQDAEDAPFDEQPPASHTVIANGTAQPSNPEAPDPSVINEIRDLAASSAQLHAEATNHVCLYGYGSVRSLNRQQSLQTLAMLLTHKAGLADKIPQALAKAGVKRWPDVSVEAAESMIASLRKRIESMAKPEPAAAGN